MALHREGGRYIIINIGKKYQDVDDRRKQYLLGGLRMKIEHVVVHNYRNIDGIDMWLNLSSNYIVGENNLGKSNFLEMLSTVCNGKAFLEDDYFDTDNPIEVELQIRMELNEIGFFGDNFDSNDETVIHLKYYQRISEAYPSLICLDTLDNLPIKLLRKIDFFMYESTAQPSKELQFSSKRGLGLLIQGMVSQYTDEQNPSFFNEAGIEELKVHINTQLEKVRGLKMYGLGADVSNNKSDMVTNLFFLSDGERKIENAGAGVQYTAMACIAVLAHIMSLFSSKTVRFEDRLYENEEGLKVLPIVLAIDEPEVHLHPYLQRSLVRFYKRILTNLDQDFLDLIKTCFDIDRLSGQLIIVTHSTDALIDDYQNIIRFYRESNITKIVSGSDHSFTLSLADQKQLLMRFPDIKEAFFAHVVILIEGETEYGCIPAFSEKMGVFLDDYSVCVVNAQGEGKIKPLASLFMHFGIKTISVYDGDVRNGVTPSDTEFYSTEPCFEFEVMKGLCSTGNYQLARNIAVEIYPRALTELIDANYIKKPYTSKLGLDIRNYVPKTLASISETDPEFYNVFSSWLYAKKGVITGRVIGKMLPESLIPQCYKDAINKAVEIAGGER